MPKRRRRTGAAARAVGRSGRPRGSAAAGGGATRALASPWLFGPASDLLLGCGALYGVLFAALAVAGPMLRELQPGFVFPILVLLLSTPHYGATLLRVYEHRRDRRSYVVFSVYASAAIALAFVAGLHSALIGSFLFTLYTTWSPWHYTGQNYGVAMMMLRRRGIAVDPRLKRLVYASFLLSYALFFLAVHSPTGSQATIAAGYLSTPAEQVRFIPLGIPPAVVGVLVPVAGLAYLCVLIAAGALLWRRASPRDLVPAGVLALTQSLWFSFPYLFQELRVSGLPDPLDAQNHYYYLVWIALGHAGQYLWVTAYYARNTERWRGLGNYYGKVLLAGTGIWFLPWLLFAPGALGRFSSESGLLAPSGASWWVLVAAINLHHFVLDGAIWKLRSHRIASVLIRSEPDPAPAIGTAAPSWGRRIVWGATALALGIAVFSALGRSAVPVALERGAYARAEAILDGLAWIGQDMPASRRQLGGMLRREGRAEDALRHYERSAALEPNAEAFLAIGSLRERAGDSRAAAAAYEAGLRVRPGARQLVAALDRVRASPDPR